MNFVKVFERKELRVNVPFAIIFPTEDCKIARRSADQLILYWSQIGPCIACVGAYSHHIRKLSQEVFPPSSYQAKTIGTTILIHKWTISYHKNCFESLFFISELINNNYKYTSSPSLTSLCNGNRTEWSPIRSVIIRVITKSRV